MFWREAYSNLYPDAIRFPTMNSAIFTCKLCGKLHLATRFRDDNAVVPTTITTAKNGNKEYYFLCVDHKEAAK